MISRPTSFVLMALAAAAGGVLFHVSFEVSELDDRLATLNHEIRNDRDAIHVLRAEWSFLNQPERLEELARRHLDLMPVSGAQLTGPGALPVRPDSEIPADGMRPAIEGLGTPIVAEAGAPRAKPAIPKRGVVTVATAPTIVSATASADQTASAGTRSLDDVLREITGPGAPR